MSFSNHDPRTISTFEIIGSYFVDTLFNHIYHNAKSNCTKESSLADEYIRRVQAYVLGVKTDTKCYNEVVQSVHKYFTQNTRYSSLSFSDFADKIVGLCVPPEFFQQFTPQNKDELLGTILCDLIANLSTFATKPEMLRGIVDDHAKTAKSTIRTLQDTAVSTLINMKITLHNKFLQKTSQARDNVSVETLDEMKRILRKLVKDKADLTAELNDAKHELLATKREFKQREAKLIKLVELLKQERKDGAASVGASLTVPKRDLIAENTHPENSRPHLPKQEAIAEKGIPGAIPEKGSAPVVPAAGPVPLNFFKTSVIPTNPVVRAPAVRTHASTRTPAPAPVPAPAPQKQSAPAAAEANDRNDDIIDKLIQGDFDYDTSDIE